MPLVAAGLTAVLALVAVGGVLWLLLPTSDPHPIAQDTSEPTSGPAEPKPMPQPEPMPKSNQEPGSGAEPQPQPPPQPESESAVVIVPMLKAMPTEPPLPPVLPPPLLAEVQVKRRTNRTADQLNAQLVELTRSSVVEEFAFPHLKNHQAIADILTLTKFAEKNIAAREQPLPDLFANDPRLAGFPFRIAKDYRRDLDSAQQMHFLSKRLRQLIVASTKVEPKPFILGFDFNRVDNRVDELFLRQQLFPGAADQPHRDWMQPEAVPVLEQLLLAETTPVRRLLVELLKHNPDPTASLALARRALYDLSDQVREEAIRALAQRPGGEHESLLLAGLRHPWAAVADHAAEAIVALRWRQVVPQLVELLDAPDPLAPQQQGQVRVVRRLTKVNHLGSCVLCHAVSLKRKDLLRQLMPAPTQVWSIGLLDNDIDLNLTKHPGASIVRADITYLQQDFALTHTVEKSGRWPKLQRYDYFIRTVTLPASGKIPGAGEGPAADKAPIGDYPQRQAVLFALRELTGQDAGPNAADWRRILEPMR